MLKHPLSTLHIALLAAGASTAAGIIGMLILTVASCQKPSPVSSFFPDPEVLRSQITGQDYLINSRFGRGGAVVSEVREGSGALIQSRETRGLSDGTIFHEITSGR